MLALAESPLLNIPSRTPALRAAARSAASRATDAPPMPRAFVYRGHSAAIDTHAIIDIDDYVREHGLCSMARRKAKIDARAATKSIRRCPEYFASRLMTCSAYAMHF